MLAMNKSDTYLQMLGVVLFDETPHIMMDIEKEIQKYFNSSKKTRNTNDYQKANLFEKETYKKTMFIIFFLKKKMQNMGISINVKFVRKARIVH